MDNRKYPSFFNENQFLVTKTKMKNPMCKLEVKMHLQDNLDLSSKSEVTL